MRKASLRKGSTTEFQFGCFSLEAQEGRHFKPLAFTKVFSMFFAAPLGVTLIPVLMLLFIRGEITPEISNPVNRLLLWANQPLVHFLLRFRWLTHIAAPLLRAATIYPFKRLGNKFMPLVNEDDRPFMPTAPQGISIAEDWGQATRSRAPPPRG